MAVGLVLGATPALGSASAPLVSMDATGALVAVAVSMVALTVLSVARRALDGTEAVRVAAGGSLAVAATLGVATAGRLSVLVGFWVLATAAVLALLWRSDDRSRRAATRRAGLALGAGDAALLVALAIVVWAAGDVDLARPEAAVAALVAQDIASVPAVQVVAVLLVVAALARAAQLPLPSWLPGTLAAPTPTSALLHAGVVGAGAVLLVRTGAVLDAAPVASWVLAAATVVTIVVASAAARHRHDEKGSLALSTSAQMGFMLLAVAVGAPAAALAHLAGHGLYKSARFLGAGGAVAAAVRRRRFAGHLPSGGDALGPAVAALAVGAAAALAVTVVLDGADAWVVGFALAASTAHAAWAWAGRSRRDGLVPATAAVVGVIVAGGGYLAVAALAKSALGTSVAATGGAGAVSPVAGVAALAIGLGLCAAALRHARLRPVVVASLTSIGSGASVRVPSPVSRVPAGAVRLTSMRSAP